MKDFVEFIGLDVHKKSISVAIASQGRETPVRYYGKIPNTFTALDGLIRKLNRPGSQLRFVYEAGPCGYVIYRYLKRKGIDCSVVAPSLIPKKRGSDQKRSSRCP